MTDNGAVVSPNNPEQLREIAARYHGLMGPEAAVLARSAAEIERLRGELDRVTDPSVKCNRGHSPGVPVMFWDCPICAGMCREDLERQREHADTVRRSNASMLEEIDRWREDATALAAVVETNRKCHGCGMLCTACSGAYAAALAAHEALTKEAQNEP